LHRSFSSVLTILLMFFYFFIDFDYIFDAFW
jgi:hypothetical protein